MPGGKFSRFLGYWGGYHLPLQGVRQKARLNGFLFCFSFEWTLSTAMIAFSAFSSEAKQHVASRILSIPGLATTLPIA